MHFTVRETPQQNGGGRKDEYDLAREGSMHVIQRQFIKIFLC